MPAEFNPVDIGIVLLFIATSVIFFRKGFFLSLFDLYHSILSLAASLIVAHFLNGKLGILPDVYQRAAIWSIQLLIFLLVWFLLEKTKFYYFQKVIANYNKLQLIYKFDHPLGILPGIIVGFVISTFLFSLPLTLSSSTTLHKLATNSYWGRNIAPEIFSVNASVGSFSFRPYNDFIYKISSEGSFDVADFYITKDQFLRKNFNESASVEVQRINEARSELGLSSVGEISQNTVSKTTPKPKVTTTKSSKPSPTPIRRVIVIEDESYKEQSANNKIDPESLRRSTAPTSTPKSVSINNQTEQESRPVATKTSNPTVKPRQTQEGDEQDPEIVDISAMENKIVELTNAERTKRGLSPLTNDLEIAAVSRAHSKDMAERGYFSHETPDGVTPGDRMVMGGIEFNARGENIAGNQSPELTMRAWMNSEGHRNNILGDKFKRIGVGIYPSKKYGYLFTQSFAD